MRASDTTRLENLLVEAENEAAAALMRVCPFIRAHDIEPLGVKLIAAHEEGPMDVLVAEMRIYMNLEIEQVQQLSSRFRMVRIDRYSPHLRTDPWTVEVEHIVYNLKTKELYQN